MRAALPFLFLAPAALVAATAGDPVLDLNAAVQRLAQHQGYAWETTIEPAHVSAVQERTRLDDPLPGEPRSLPSQISMRMVPVPTNGVTDKERGTMVTSSVGLLGHFDMRTVIRDGRAVAHAHDVWLTAAELDHRIAGRPPSGSKPPFSELVSAGSATTSRSSFYFTGRFQVELLPPHEDLAGLIAGALPATHAGRDRVVATLTEETAKRFAHRLRFREGPWAAPLPPSGADGTLTVWLKGGEIARYEVEIRGASASHPDSPEKGRERNVKLIQRTRVTRIGRVTVDIPPAAAERLSRD